MRYDIRYRSRSSFFNWSFPSGVKWLIVANVAIYLLYFFGSLWKGDEILRSLRLVPAEVLHKFAIWQLVTYLFLHSLQSVWHIVLNMLFLWMLGTPVEETWGTRRFLQYYFLCGIGAGVCVVVVNALIGNASQPVIGASGAIYGLLLAFGMLFPEQEVLLFFLIPIKAKYMVTIYGFVVFIGSFQVGGTVSNLAHLGGMIFGYFYIKSQFSRRRVRAAAGSGFDIRRTWKEYKLQRARKKFQVYMKKHDSRGGPWVN